MKVLEKIRAQRSPTTEQMTEDMITQLAVLKVC